MLAKNSGQNSSGKIETGLDDVDFVSQMVGISKENSSNALYSLNSSNQILTSAQINEISNFKKIKDDAILQTDEKRESENDIAVGPLAQTHSQSALEEQQKFHVKPKLID